MNLRSATIAVGFLAAVALAPPGWAHEDMIFPIENDGRLSRIPQEFGPVFLKVQGASGSPLVELEFRARSVSLEPCLGRLFFLPEGERVRAMGSWYHDLTLLPPYVSFELPQKTAGHGFFDGYSLLFNLETGGLLELQRHTVEPSGKGVKMESLPTASPCAPDNPLRLRPTSGDAPTSKIELLE